MFAQNIAFVLQNDAIENRQWQVYTELSQGVYTRILQSNNSNPKVRKLEPRRRNDYVTITEQLPDYSVRIIKNEAISESVLGSKFWALSFDGGVTGKRFIVLDIQESTYQGLAWTVILQGTNQTVNLLTVELMNTGDILEIVNTGDSLELLVL